MKTAEYMTTADAAEYLRISPTTLHVRKARGDGPTFIAIGRSIRYRRADLDAWAASLVHDPNVREAARVAA